MCACVNRDSDEEIDFGGTVDDFTKLFDYCESEDVLNKNDEEELFKGEDKSKEKTPKKKSKARGKKKKPKSKTTESPGLNSSQDDEEPSATKKVCDEFEEYMRSTRASAESAALTLPIPEPQGVVGQAPDSPVYLSSDNSTDTEVCEILDENVVLSPIVELDYLNVRVRWKGTIHKFRMSSSDKVAKLRCLMSGAVNVPTRHILLFLHEDDSTSLEDSKSLTESGVTIGLVLEGMQIVSNSNGLDVPEPAKRVIVEKDLTMIRLKLQHGTNIKDFIKMDVKKTMNFEELQYLYATKCNLKPEMVVFRFDGDIIEPEDTPESLDLEGDECIDVVISK